MMYAQEKIKPYNDAGEKGKQVEQMFDGIAHSYDRLNHMLSLGIDRRWRRKTIKALLPYAHNEILDIATGTGDFALLAARLLKPQRIVGADISEGMMQIARQKTLKAGLSDIISFKHEDCMALSFADGSFDAVTVAYGVRNYADLDRGLKEMLRVLRPGGHVAILELATPKSTPMKQLFWLYSHAVMPLVGKIVSKDKRAYAYLPQTMEAFPQGEIMKTIMERAGFSQVSFKRFTGGLSTMYIGKKK
ncbi:MAG: bifunctional demethylmenaquinone methyltransferase/2-methoxy-6-polyprenyl-1,4-benzoquinol methylase UbiE [Bacteroidaceae bacterium]|nr:bifunctional demethylmenaquinone methyltransferase/2-methoxy-6-polyprenyl-1,4-benzoquinol methylase UbiE [Bacteroidaceae bacterium]